MDITPVIPKTRHAISGYGNSCFKLGNASHSGSLLMYAETVQNWPVENFSQIDFDQLASWCAAQEGVELLLIGTGKALVQLSPAIRADFRSHHIAIEVMDTGAACRTYNVLLSEERKVAAALIAV